MRFIRKTSVALTGASDELLINLRAMYISRYHTLQPKNAAPNPCRKRGIRQANVRLMGIFFHRKISKSGSNKKHHWLSANPVMPAECCRNEPPYKYNKKTTVMIANPSPDRS